jgi:CheY-like chemotaxis protein
MARICERAQSELEDKHRTEETGFNAHLVKPVELRALKALLASLSPG